MSLDIAKPLFLESGNQSPLTYVDTMYFRGMPYGHIVKVGLENWFMSMDGYLSDGRQVINKIENEYYVVVIGLNAEDGKFACGWSRLRGLNISSINKVKKLELYDDEGYLQDYASSQRLLTGTVGAQDIVKQWQDKYL